MEIDPREIGKNYPVTVPLLGDARAGLEDLLTALAPGGGSSAYRESAYFAEIQELKAAWFRQVEVKSGATDVPMTMARAVREIQAATRDDAIVVGSRAYQTDTALVHHNARLLRYADRGGLVLVQYQQYPFIQGQFAPYPLTIARPHDRVTDETAAVNVLVPDSPVFTTPNKITGADWDGWPQERGLYFAHTWAKPYTPLLEMHDPGDPPLEGGLLVARLGAGTYVYTGLAFFRALPAGVPGAYRLFLNLLALKAR